MGSNSSAHCDEVTVTRKLEKLGRGSFGVVWKVKCSDERILAAKYLPASGTLDIDVEQIQKELESEKNLRKLRHPNIMQFVRMYYDSCENQFVVLSEVIDGMDIRKMLRRREKIGVIGFDKQEVKAYSKQILLGLQYLHHHEPTVIHRDIKGKNIMVTPDGVVKLVDFGQSVKLKLVTNQSYKHAVYQTDTLVGTLRYMAPELFSRFCYSTQSDIWAFGCTVWEMVTGHIPFKDSSDSEVDLVVRTSGAPKMPTSVSSSLNNFYSHCVAKDPSYRWSATELLGHWFLI